MSRFLKNSIQHGKLHFVTDLQQYEWEFSCPAAMWVANGECMRIKAIG